MKKCLNVFALEANNANYSLFGNKFFFKKKKPAENSGTLHEPTGTPNPKPWVTTSRRGLAQSTRDIQGRILAEEDQGA